MRTFNGLQIFTEQLTNSGQLDMRYVRISGNNSIPNLNLGVIIGQNGIPTAEFYPGVSGQIMLDNNNIYVCSSGNGVGNGRWKFVSLTDWPTL